MKKVTEGVCVCVCFFQEWVTWTTSFQLWSLWNKQRIDTLLWLNWLLVYVLMLLSMNEDCTLHSLAQAQSPVNQSLRRVKKFIHDFWCRPSQFPRCFVNRFEHLPGFYEYWLSVWRICFVICMNWPFKLPTWVDFIALFDKWCLRCAALWNSEVLTDHHLHSSVRDSITPAHSCACCVILHS